jgi:hypothetical protein
MKSYYLTVTVLAKRNIMYPFPIVSTTYRQRGSLPQYSLPNVSYTLAALILSRTFRPQICTSIFVTSI